MAKTAREEAQKLIADNRKAHHDFHLIESFEAGVALLGTEVKAIREGGANLRDSYARIEGGEVWLYNVHIRAYSSRGYSDHEPTRRRKLLLHRQEIRRLIGGIERKGLTLIPLELYFNPRGIAKVRIALAKGKKQHDKREDERKRDDEREMARAFARGRNS